MTVDVAMNTRIASAMAAESSYDLVVFQEGLDPGPASSEDRTSAGAPATLEISAPEAADAAVLVARVRGVEDR